MRLEQDRLGQLKNYIYIGSSAILFLTWCLSLGALTQSGASDGRLTWVFGLCFLTIPLVIYQSLTPIWSRTARYSNPHAHCVVDGLLSICWFTAWVSLTSYVVSGKGHGSDKKKTGCDNFAHGNASKCKISEADIFFSVILMLCFIATAFFSFKVLMEYKRTGIAPNSTSLGAGKFNKSNISNPQSIHKEDDEAFDSRLDVGHNGVRDGYSFEAARVQGGGPDGEYGGYSSVPGADDGYGNGSGINGRPTSFGGPLGSNRI